MKKTLLVIFTLFVLHSQLAWAKHAYVDHDAADSCEYCLNLQLHAVDTDSQSQLQAGKYERQEAVGVYFETWSCISLRIRGPPVNLLIQQIV